MHLSSAWLQTKENLLPVYGGRDFDLWFSFSSLSLSLRWIFSREASFLSDFLALISTLFFFSPAFRELGRDCSSRLSETCSLTCPLPPTFSMRFLLPLSRYLLYFPFFSLFVPLISATFVRVVSSRRFKIRASNFFPNFFPSLLQGEDSSNLGIPRILNVQSKAISIQISASRGAGFFSNFQTFDL